MDPKKIGVWRDALNSMKGNLLTRHTEHHLGAGQPEGEGAEGAGASPHVTAISGHPEHVAAALHHGKNHEKAELPTQGDSSEDPGEVEGAEGSFSEGPGNTPELDPKSRMVSRMHKDRKS
jgi:hypothetical protein